MVNEKYENFSSNTMVYIKHAIENQHKGLPHAHIEKIKMDDSSEVITDKRMKQSKYIDCYIDDDNAEHFP